VSNYQPNLQGLFPMSTIKKKNCFSEKTSFHPQVKIGDFTHVKPL